MNADRPRNVRSGVIHHMSRLDVEPKPGRETEAGTELTDSDPYRWSG